MNIFQANIYHVSEKPYGVGKTANERHTYIVGGWRGEVISGIDDDLTIYTGKCDTVQGCKDELISQLKAHGYKGILRTA
jgi:hypothetical protein